MVMTVAQGSRWPLGPVQKHSPVDHQSFTPSAIRPPKRQALVKGPVLFTYHEVTLGDKRRWRTRICRQYNAPLMRHDLNDIARRHFAHIENRHDRLREAECHLVGEFFSCVNDGFFVEVGAFEPVHASQTWHLAQRGWSGVLIEPIAELCEQLRAKRPESVVVETACSAPEQAGEAALYIPDDISPQYATLAPDQLHVGANFTHTRRVPVRTLDDVLNDITPAHIDFVCIDVEGIEFDVLRGFTLSKHRPALLMIEDHLYHLRTHRLVRSHGYRLVKRTGNNNWYVPTDAPFDMTTADERLRLWRKIALGTPLRRARFVAKRFMTRRR